MTTNQYFNNYSSNNEQSVYEDLLIESIKTYGFNVKYMPRISVQSNPIIGEDVNRFENTYEIEMFLSNFDGYEGSGTYLSKFGIEIKDEIKLVVTKKRFEATVTAANNRPNEGDLIFFPFGGNVFQVKFVDHDTMFYKFGKLYVYVLTCELFEYNSEEFATGNNSIDFTETYSWTVDLQMENGNNVEYTNNEIITVSNNIFTTAEVISWNSNNDILSVINLTGELTPGDVLIGTTSGAEWSYAANSSFLDDSLRFPNKDFVDNYNIQEQSNTIIDSSETNPFGGF